MSNRCQKQVIGSANEESLCHELAAHGLHSLVKATNTMVVAVVGTTGTARGCLLSAHTHTHLKVAMDDALVVQVLDGPQEGPHQVSRLLLVVERLGYDAVEQLPP